jgi:hypothetical protein
VSKAHLLELFQEGLWRSAGMNSTSLATLRTRHALALPLKAKPIFKGEVAIVPRPELPLQIEPEEQPLVTMRMAEVTVLEMRHMTKPEHEIAVPELEHETAAEVPRLGVQGMPELKGKTTVVEVPEVTRLERPRLSKEATVVELEAMVSRVQLRASGP